jgi:hypothetical protein
MTTTDLVPVSTESTMQALALVGPAGDLVAKISNSAFVPPAWRGKPDELLAAILTGHELGLPPMAAIGKMHNIQGRATLSAEAARAIVQSRGHEIWLEQVSAEKVVACGRRRGEENTVRITWTMADARRAGVAGKEVWRKFPQAMLTARATADLCRAHFADCLSGISYFKEELEDGVLDESGAPATGDLEERDAPAPTARTRSLPKKKATRAKAAPKPAAAAPAPPADPVAEVDELDQLGVTAPADDEIVDAEIVEDDEPAIDIATDRGLRPDQALAKRAGEVGLDDDRRHGLYIAVTSGRTATGKELTPDEVRTVFELLDAAEAGRLRVEADEPGCWTVFVDDAEAFFGVDEAQADAAGASGSPGLPADADGWRDLVAEHGRKVAETLKAVQGLADELGVSDPPRSIGALADADERLQRAVVDWVRGVS